MASVLRLAEIARVLRERWRIVAITTLVVVVLTLAISLIVPPRYTARTTLYVAARTSENVASVYQGTLLSQQRVSSYVELVTNPRVLDPVIATLRLPYTERQLASKVTAASELNSLLISIDVVSSSSEEAALIANSISDTLPGLINQLEQPPGPNTQPLVSVRVVEEATPPAVPSSPGIGILLPAALLLGLILGGLIALALAAVDSTIKSRDRLAHITRGVVLGSIPRDEEIDQHRLVVADLPRSIHAEAYRQLRTALQYVRVDDAPHIIMITSALPGEGKTTTIANLGAALCQSGKSVLLIDCDLRKPNLSELLSIESAVGVTNLLTGDVEPRDAVQSGPEGLDVLASGPVPPNPSELLASRSMQELLQWARAHYDFVLVDSPPLLPVTDAAAMSNSVDGVILACRHGRTKETQVGATVENLRAVSADVLGAILTVTPARGVGAYGYYGEYVAERAAHARNGQAGSGLGRSVPDRGEAITRPQPRPQPQRRSK